MNFGFYNDKGKEDVSIFRVIGYIFMFLIPIMLAYVLSNYVAIFLSHHLTVSPRVATEIFMMFFTLVIFFFMVPFIRMRTGIRGVKFSLFLFMLVSLAFAIPPMYYGHYNILFIELIFMANYILATFMNCPDVIGIGGDVEDWFKHKVQLMILLIYASIVFFYIFGFAFIYYELSLDPEYPSAFAYSNGNTPSYVSFLSYSVATFTSIDSGGITPLSDGAKLLVGIQALMAVTINVIFIACLLLFISNFSMIEEKLQEKRLRKDETVLRREGDEIKRTEKEILHDIELVREHKEHYADPRFNYMDQKTASTNKYPNYFDQRNK